MFVWLFIDSIAIIRISSEKMEINDVIVTCRILLYEFGKSGKDYREASFTRISLKKEERDDFTKFRDAVK